MHGTIVPQISALNILEVYIGISRVTLEKFKTSWGPFGNFVREGIEPYELLKDYENYLYKSTGEPGTKNDLHVLPGRSMI